MGTKAEQLAAKFEQTAKDFESKIKALSDSEWRANTPEEGRTVAACAHHAAASATPLSMMVQAAATGGAMPAITQEGLDQMNAEHAKQFANVSKEDTLKVLNETTPQAAQVVRALSDEQLARKATLPFGMEMSAEQIVENVLIGHIQGHGASIAAAVPA